ncbi:hypothetical protein, partial [Lentzea sp. NPDC003310]|uniref:hypothetical protein n=1 Tax=Lentzea sp. NPDC003310 TaxID=3154447 RepID=UPI0033AACC97
MSSDQLAVRAAEAEAKAHAGDFRGAAADLRSLAREHVGELGADDPRTLAVRLNLARVLGTAKQFRKAVEVCEPLLRDQVRVGGGGGAPPPESRPLLAKQPNEAGDPHLHRDARPRPGRE